MELSCSRPSSSHSRIFDVISSGREWASEDWRWVTALVVSFRTHVGVQMPSDVMNDWYSYELGWRWIGQKL